MFKTNIERIRSVWKLRQDEIGKLFGVSQKTISGYEAGKSEPSISTGLRISKLTGFTIQELVEDEIQFERIPKSPLLTQVEEPEDEPIYKKSPPQHTNKKDLTNLDVLISTVERLDLNMERMLTVFNNLDEDGNEKLKVLNALFVVAQYLESELEEAEYAEEKKLMLEKLAAALGGKA